MSEQNSGRAVLTYNLDEEYQIRIEKPEEFHQSYFKDVYSQASKAVTGIVKQRNGQKEDNNPFLKEKKEFNNIVAFVGGRGTGKTSCMVSFANYLIGGKDKEENLDNFEIEELSEHKFISLPTIDPSLFEKDENIIEVVLAQMFSDFESILKNRQGEVEQDTRRKLIELFDVVYRNLQTVIKGRANYDGESLETLSKLAQSTKLRDNFKNLIHKFIKLKSNSEKGYLIIPIDDFDLNIKSAPEMSEQIRKYFMIPNVILLMSVNIEQLRDAKELSIKNEYLGKERLMEEDPARMAVEYLLKLIPNNRRFYMPEIKYNLDNIYISNKKIAKIAKDVIEPIKIDKYVFESIFKKTGLIFIPNREENHILIPNTLRLLKEFVYFLENILKDGDIYNKENFMRFEDYMVYSYLPSLISKKYYKLFNNIANSGVMQLNWTVIQSFNDVVANEFYKKKSELCINDRDYILLNSNTNTDNYNNELYELLTRANNAHNISLGDALFVINLTERYINTNEFRLFCKAIKILYSIEIYKTLINNNAIEIKTIIGNSLLPSEHLSKVVQSRKYSNKNGNNTFHISRITFEYNNKFSNNDIYKYFVIYNGNSYLHRRRSPRDFFDGYGFDENNDYKLDIFSSLVNSVYMSDEFAKLNNDSAVNKHWDRTIINKCAIPFYSIDLIEKVLYKSFRFNVGDKLSQDIIEIFRVIKSRIETSKIISRYDNIKSFLVNSIEDSFVYNNIVNNSEFVKFIDSIEKEIICKQDDISVNKNPLDFNDRANNYTYFNQPIQKEETKSKANNPRKNNTQKK